MTDAGLAGKRVLVTGAGSGIGRATTIAFARAGARVAALDMNREAVEDTVVTAAAESHVFSVAADVSEEAAVRQAFGVADEVLDGAPEIVVNVAGIGSTTSAEQTDLDTWEKVFAVNCRGTFLVTREALSSMLAVRSGSIVNVASVAGLVGLRARAAYCASKGAVIAFTRAVAVDHARDGIRANCVCPGTIDTPWVRRLVMDSGESIEQLAERQLTGRLGTPVDVANAITFLASDSAAFATGTVLTLDGGLTAA